MSFVEWSAALTMGLMGSTHCVAMCGPISTLLIGRGAPDDARDRMRLPLAGAAPSSWKHGLATHAGRLATYATLGAMAGTLGGGIRHLIPLEFVQLAARCAAAAVLVGAGLHIAGVFGGRSKLERWGAPLFGRLSALLTRETSSGVRGRLIRGAIWGLMPCGLVMSALGLAMVSGTPAQGALTLAVFGLGTLPSLTAFQLFLARFARVLQTSAIRRLAGVLVVVAGLVQVVFAVEGARALGDADAPRPCCAHRRAMEEAAAREAAANEAAAGQVGSP